MIIFYKEWKKVHTIKQLTKKMDLNNRKIKYHTGLARARAYNTLRSLTPKVVNELYS